MHEVRTFGLIVLLVAAAFALAVLSSRLSDRVSVPGPALFLLAAAVLSDVFPSLGKLQIRTVERIGVVALIVILFDGGTRIGLRRLRTAWVPVLLLGLPGTFATAGIVAVSAHWLLDFSWTTSGLIGAAIAPTDPAVMFSVLGRREVSGRTGTILEGESGTNDPVGIALMIGMIEFATSNHATFWTVVREFVLEMSAGLVVGDARAPYTEESERFFTSLASLAEIVMFVALGLTINLTGLSGREWLDGVVLAVLLALVVRPLVAGALLLPTHLRAGERL